MSRTTIDFGIDLGTTNSVVGMLKGTGIHVFKNNFNSECTPSAILVDSKNSIIVGNKAKEGSMKENAKVAFEFKQKMGTNYDYELSGGKKMTPEELSSEVLKSLKKDVERFGENMESAVITVPAAFDVPSCNATKKAAQLAGLRESPLLQEPVAAAQAYGFQEKGDNVFWLVYDFGGGTFDAAVIHVNDGIISVVNHAGDNQLGGKLLDWAIVEELLIPAVVKMNPRKFSDFRRGNARWNTTIAKLKYYSEIAKIELSSATTALVEIPYLCMDESNSPIEFVYELNRADVERLSRPFVLRSINMCKKALEEKRLGPDNIQKILLVGGMTLAPYLRERLADKNEGLGISLEFSVDPLIVVAQGAAIFAGTQRAEQSGMQKAVPGQFSIELDYKPMDSDQEPNVGGKITPPEKDMTLDGFTLEFSNSGLRPPWGSGGIPLDQNKSFFTTLKAQKGINEFEMELRDCNGGKQNISPSRFSYICKDNVLGEQALINSIGVGLSDNTMYIFFEKGSPLPARKRKLLKTAHHVHKDKKGERIYIPLKEGNMQRADRNYQTMALVIESHEIKRDVPEGSEVEVTVDMSKDRIMTVEAYIPILDETFRKNQISDGDHENVDNNEMKKRVDEGKKRFEELNKKIKDIPDEKAQKILRRVEDERTMHDIENSFNVSEVEPDAGSRCQKRLLDLHIALDEAEREIEWPILVDSAEKLISTSKMIIKEYGETGDLSELDNYERQIRKAISSRDADILSSKIGDLQLFLARILDRKGVLQVIWFEQLVLKRGEMRNQSEADQIINQGRRAINSNDIETLRSLNAQLASLLPAPPPPPDAGSLNL